MIGFVVKYYFSPLLASNQGIDSWVKLGVFTESTAQSFWSVFPDRSKVNLWFIWLDLVLYFTTMLLCFALSKKTFFMLFFLRLLVNKKFVFLTFVNNLFFCSKMLPKDWTLISTIHLTSLVKHLKIVGILQNFEICTKFCPLHNSIL